MSKTHKKNKQASSGRKFLWIGGIILVSVLLLVLKNFSNRTAKSETLPLAGTSTLAPVEFAKEVIAEESLEETLDRLIFAKEPVFAFFHSNNCQLCLQMIDIVNEVYPEYQGQVSLVDINVYDDANKNLLLRANIHSIPTQIFIQSNGEGFQTVGVMSPDQLRDALGRIAEE